LNLPFFETTKKENLHILHKTHPQKKTTAPPAFSPKKRSSPKMTTNNTFSTFNAGTAERLMMSADSLDFALQGMYFCSLFLLPAHRCVPIKVFLFDSGWM
jgi:hypothetical protein